VNKFSAFIPFLRRSLTRRTLLALLAATLLLTALGWVYSEWVPGSNWNGRNIKQIVAPESGALTFAVFGDNMSNGPIFNKILKAIQADPAITFALGVGDQVRGSEEPQLRNFIFQVRERTSKPLLTVLGNHDLDDKGRTIHYLHTFGKLNYAFALGDTWFIFFDDASEDALEKKQLKWLASALKEGQQYKTRLVFTHIPLFDPRPQIEETHCKNEKDARKMLELFSTWNVSHIFTGHIHGYFTGRWQGIPFTISGGGGSRLHGTDPAVYFYHYLVVRVKDGQVAVEVRKVAP
jgi:hypothetical protein